MTEVEVSPSGEWRVAGSEGRWHSILEDPAIPVEDIKVKEDPEGLKQEAGQAHIFPPLCQANVTVLPTGIAFWQQQP